MKFKLYPTLSTRMDNFWRPPRRLPIEDHDPETFDRIARLEAVDTAAGLEAINREEELEDGDRIAELELEASDNCCSSPEVHMVVAAVRGISEVIAAM